MKKFTALLALMTFTSLSVQAVELPGPLVDTDWLQKHASQVTILDVRADEKSFTGKPVYSKDKKTGKLTLVRVGGHIPGARLIDYKQIRDKRMIDGREVTRMVPAHDKFEKVMQSAGLGAKDSIVIVSEGENNGDMTMATRLYWTLKYYGHDKLAILNGGTAAWLLDGKPVTADAPKPSRGDWRATQERREMLATSEDVANAVKSRDAQLMDTREISQYLGTYYKKSYVYDKGHIPGAKNFPNELLTQQDTPAKFFPADQVRQLAQTLGINTEGKIITYCNSGHLASGSWFLMSEVLGNKNVRLYDGSMHQWTLEKRPTTSMQME